MCGPTLLFIIGILLKMVWACCRGINKTKQTYLTCHYSSDHLNNKGKRVHNVNMNKVLHKASEPNTDCWFPKWWIWFMVTASWPQRIEDQGPWAWTMSHSTMKNQTSNMNHQAPNTAHQSPFCLRLILPQMLFCKFNPSKEGFTSWERDHALR